MEEFFNEFHRLIADASDRLAGITDAQAAVPIAPGRWSRKQIVGHLIDSASNNHQRFVRGQLADNPSLELSFPDYEQDRWVEVQRYGERGWAELLMLWRGYNLHLLHTAAAMPQEKLANRCRVGEDDPITLRFLIEDYVRHVRHHLEQVIGRMSSP